MDSTKIVEIITMLLDTYKTVLFICLGIIVVLVVLLLIFKKQRSLFNVCVSLLNTVMLLFGAYTLSLFATALINKMIAFNTESIIALVIGVAMWIGTRFVPAKKKPKQLAQAEEAEGEEAEE